MNLLSPISTIMSSDFITISPNDYMKRVEEIFQKHSVQHLPVVSHGRLVGVVSRSDYRFFKRGFNDQSTDDLTDLFRLKVWRVDNVMSTQYAKMDQNERINKALDIFSRKLFHAIIIMEDAKIVGIVTTFDIINHLIHDKSAIYKYELG